MSDYPKCKAAGLNITPGSGWALASEVEALLGQAVDRAELERYRHIVDEEQKHSNELRSKNAYLEQNYNEANDNVKILRARLEKAEAEIDAAKMENANLVLDLEWPLLKERDKYKAALEKLSGQHPAKPIWSASKMTWRLYVDKLEKWRLEITGEALK